MSHIVVVGAGTGGVPAAYELRHALGGEHRITLVGSSPRFELADDVRLGLISPSR